MMSCRRSLVILILGSLTSASAATPQESQEVEALIQKLGASDIAIREAATRDLLAKGQPIRPALDKAARSPDGELAARAKSILDQLDRHIDATSILLEKTWKNPETSVHRKLRDTTISFRSACKGLDPDSISKSLERQGIPLQEKRHTYLDEKEYLARSGAYVSPGGIRHDLLLTIERAPVPSKGGATTWAVKSVFVTLIARPRLDIAAVLEKPYPADSIFGRAFDHKATREAAAEFPIVGEIEVVYQLYGSHREQDLSWAIVVDLELMNRDRSAGVTRSYFGYANMDPGELRSGEKLDAGFVVNDAIEKFDGGSGGSWSSAKGTMSRNLERIDEKNLRQDPPTKEVPVVYGAGDLKKLPAENESLVIRGEEFDSDDCEGMLRFTKLRTLQWWYKKQVAGRAIEALARIKTLEELDLIGWGSATDQDLERLATLPQLRRLSLSDTADLTDAGAAHAAKMKELTYLNLHWCGRLTDAAMKSFSEMQKLQTLHLWGSGNLTDEGLAHLSRSVQLQRLTLSHSKSFTSKGWGNLEKLQSLRYLSLGYLSMDDAGVAVLSRMSSLEEISLHGLKQLTDDGLKSLKSLKNLKSLHLWECSGITTKGLKELQAALPGKFKLD